MGFGHDGAAERTLLLLAEPVPAGLKIEAGDLDADCPLAGDGDVGLVSIADGAGRERISPSEALKEIALDLFVGFLSYHGVYQRQVFTVARRSCQKSHSFWISGAGTHRRKSSMMSPLWTGITST